MFYTKAICDLLISNLYAAHLGVGPEEVDTLIHNSAPDHLAAAHFSSSSSKTILWSANETDQVIDYLIPWSTDV